MSPDDPLPRPLPLARSILWAPASGRRRPTDIPFPIFLAQSALSAIHEHAATSQRPGQGILGFLLGDLCECPETGVSYLVIDAALRLNQALYGDRSRDVVTRLWDRVQAQLEEQKAHLIGWYHTHAPLPLVLSPDDVETHEHYFGAPWQVAMLVGTDAAAPAGAFFRAGADGWVEVPLPFYELLKEESIRPDGKKRSFVIWKNYRPFNAVVPQGANATRAPAPPEEPPAEPAAAPPQPEPAAAPPGPPPPAGRRSGPTERSSELKFLTTAEDFATPTHAHPKPAERVQPPAAPPPRPPVRPPHREAAPEPEAPPPAPAEEATSAAPEEAGSSEWPGEEFAEAEQPVAEAWPEEELAPPEVAPPRRRRRRRWRWRRPSRITVALILAAAAGVAYWWFQPQLPSLNWSGPWSAITTEWSVVRTKASALADRLKHALPAPTTGPRARPRPPQSPTGARPRTPPPATVPPAARAAPAGPGPYAPLDQSGDALAQVMRTFGERAAQFSRSPQACADLAHALATVEQRWAAYASVRRTTGGLDAAHAARGQALYAGVDSAERRFDTSGCERP